MTVWSKLGLLGKCHFISISGEILIEKGPSQGVLASLHSGWGGALKGLLSPPLQLNTLRLYKEDAVGMPNMLQICTLHIVHINSLLTIMPVSFMFNIIYVFEVEIHKRLFSMPN